MILPRFDKRRGIWAPVAAVVIGSEMLLFFAVHIFSGDPNAGPSIYWLVLAAVCAFVACGRFVPEPHHGPATMEEIAA